MVAPVVAAPITPDDGFAMETFVSVEKRGCCCSVLHEKSCENRPLRRTRSRRQAQPLHFSQRTRLLRRSELLSFILQSVVGAFVVNRESYFGGRLEALRAIR